MFRLIIADDEIRIREGFTRIVNWEELGFRVVGCYADGSQILEHLRREHADVVLTDIKMKQVGGLEVAREIHEHYPNTVCVLVSAHQEFDFAHAAIAAGVKEYLFKPTRIADIRRVFSNIAQELEHESELMEKRAEAHRKYEEMNQLWRSQFLYDLYMGALRRSDMANEQAGHYYPEYHKPGVLLCFLNYTASDQQEETRDVLRRLFQGSTGGLDYDPVNIKSSRLAVMALFDAAQDGMETQFHEEMSDLAAQARETSGIQIEIDEFRRYDSLQAFIERPRFGSEPGERKTVLDDSIAQEFFSRQRLLFSYLTSRSQDQASALVDEIVTRLRPFPLDIQHSVLIDTAARIQTRLADLQLVPYTMPRYEMLFTAIEPEQMAAWLENTIAHWMESIPSTNTPQQVISQIRNYVMDHFSDQLSLDVVAEQVFLSPVYVSRLFKQETGENFTDYITRVRIEKAKELLSHPEILVCDVGRRVGYPNPRYFYRVFKNMTGATPSSYRSGLMGEATEG